MINVGSRNEMMKHWFISFIYIFIQASVISNAYLMPLWVCLNCQFASENHLWIFHHFSVFFFFVVVIFGTAGTDGDRNVHPNQFVHAVATILNKMPLFFLHVTFSSPGRASISDHVQPVEQADSFKQSSLALHPGRQWHHGEVRCRGQAATSVRETHLPAEDQHTWVNPPVSNSGWYPNASE